MLKKFTLKIRKSGNNCLLGIKRKTILLVTVSSLFLIPTLNLEAQEGILKVWDFNQVDMVNFLGGHFSAWERRPSTAVAGFNRKVVRGRGGNSFKIDYFKNGNISLVWMDLFDSGAPEEKRKFVDGFTYQYLSFFVKGAKGGEDFSIQMADIRWVEKEDALIAGKISEYLTRGVTTEWQEVVIPVTDFVLAKDVGKVAPHFRLDLTQLARIVFLFTESGRGTVFIDDISFKREADLKVFQTECRMEEKVKEYNKAMWVWRSLDLLLDEEKREEFFKFCQERNVNRLFFQLQYRFTNEDNPHYRLKHPDKLRAFLREANKRGIKVYSLDGYPSFALTPWHPMVLAQIKAVIEFNKKGGADERFYGIRFNNEPHTLLAFRELEGAREILRQFLDITRKSVDLIEESGADLSFGVDIPAWWDRENLSIEYDGKVKPAVYHIIDMVDNIALMAYRNRAGGAGGIIAISYNEIQYAAKRGRDVYIGVETFQYDPGKVFFLVGMPKSEFYSKMGKTDLGYHRTIGRFKTRMLDDGVNLHAGLLLSPDLNGKINSEFKGALLELGDIFSQNVWPDEKPKLDSILFDAEQKINRCSEREGFEIKEIRSDREEILYVGFKVSEVMPAFLTFRGYPRSFLDEQLHQTALFFSPHPSFYGFAIHYYRTYREMCVD